MPLHALKITVILDNAFVWKFSARQNIIGKKLVARGSVSTGFRAPTLQQVYLSTIQNVFANGKIVTEGLFNNVGKEAKAVGIPSLDAEKSLNFTLGLGIQPNKNFTITIDGYLINVYDRILLSSRMSDKTINSRSFKQHRNYQCETPQVFSSMV